jgi:hypothetical protein
MLCLLQPVSSTFGFMSAENYWYRCNLEHTINIAVISIDTKLMHHLNIALENNIISFSVLLLRNFF